MRKLKDFTFREIWKKIKANWRVQYRFVVKNIDTHEEKLTFRLSLQRIFVVTMVSAVFLIFLTAMLIAFTPLRVYVPGYTTPDEYRKYKKLAAQVDSINLLVTQNQQYIDNFYRIMQDKIEVENVEDTQTEKTEKKETKGENHDKALNWLEKESKKIKEKYHLNTSVPLTTRADISTFFPQTPVKGKIIEHYNIEKQHYGVDIKCAKNELVTTIEDGVVIFAGYEPGKGNTIIVQHKGNLISKYQRNDILLKTPMTHVECGEPIAKTGASGTDEQGVHLHFELWYNGVPLNPEEYLLFAP